MNNPQITQITQIKNSKQEQEAVGRPMMPLGNEFCRKH